LIFTVVFIILSLLEVEDFGVKGDDAHCQAVEGTESSIMHGTYLALTKPA
jgi:hypothetical protein